MHKIVTHSILFGLLGCGVFSGAYATCNTEASPDWSQTYSDGSLSFECNVKRYCIADEGMVGGVDKSKQLAPWNIDSSSALIKDHSQNFFSILKKRYPDLSKKNLSLQEINTIYETTQNRVTNCAILKSKTRIHKEMLDRKDVSEPFKKLLKKLNQKINSQMKEYQCTYNKKTTPLLLQKTLLDSLSFELCNYSYYLLYMESYKSENIGELVDGGVITARELGNTVANFNSEILQSQQYAIQVYESVVTQFTGFEQSYPAHVLLENLKVELLQLRKYTSVTVKAVVQTFLKALNAQNPDV